MSDTLSPEHIASWREILIVWYRLDAERADAFIEGARGPVNEVARTFNLEPMEIIIGVSGMALRANAPWLNEGSEPDGSS